MHGVLEIVPAIATAIVAILKWPDFLSLFGIGDTHFALELKHVPLPGWYLAAVLLGVALFGALPYSEELLRTARGATTWRRRANWV